MTLPADALASIRAHFAARDDVRRVWLYRLGAGTAAGGGEDAFPLQFFAEVQPAPEGFAAEGVVMRELTYLLQPTLLALQRDHGIRVDGVVPLRAGIDAAELERDADLVYVRGSVSGS
jgi:hypothetical protein